MDKTKESLEDEIRNLIISTLELEDVTSATIELEAPLFGDGLGLDSIDALELGVALQKRYGLTIDAEDDDMRQNFYSVKTLVEFVSARRAK
jgi:acyl carrier protein